MNAAKDVRFGGGLHRAPSPGGEGRGEGGPISLWRDDECCLISEDDRWRLLWFGHPRFGAVLALVAGVCVMLGTGCASRGTADKTPAVQSLHLFSVPQAVNLDDEPGPDGFAVRLFARGPKSSKGVAFPNGALEIAMFEGLLPDASGSTNQSLRTWEFTGSELKQHAGQSAVGTGYRFTLRWMDARPAGSRISIVARYLPPSGPAISSAPSTVAIGAK